MKRIFKVVLILLLGMSAFNSQAATLYLTETDMGGTVYIIDTETGTFQTVDVSPQENPGAIAVFNDRIVMANYQDSGSWEYDLNLVPTGNSWIGSDQWSQMLDGTTDGTNNYSVSWSSHGVIEMDLNFENGAVLFNPGFSVIGITYDPTDDTLWLVNDDDGTVRHYSKAGIELDSFDPGLAERACCLAYDQSTDTLWMSENGESTMYEFDKTGALLRSVVITGLSASNTWGAEIGTSGAVVITATSTEPVPAMNIYAMGILMLMLMIMGGFMVRRYTH